MYKLLLCWRYLRTRHIALASVVSVTLGVATMIVVNSVMAGFSHEMQNRIHGILSDVVFESLGLEGFRDPQWHMQQIRRAAGDDIQGMTATVHVPAMLSFPYGGEWITRQVTLIGIDEKTQAQAGDFGDYLQHPENRRRLSFTLRENGYDTRDHQSGSTAALRPDMERAGWEHRRRVVESRRAYQAQVDREEREREASERQVHEDEDADPQPDQHDDEEPGEFDEQGAETPANPDAVCTCPEDCPCCRARQKTKRDRSQAQNPFLRGGNEGHTFDPLREQHTGLVMGIALPNYRDKAGNERFLVLPGDDVKLTFPTASMPPRAVDDTFTVVDFYESKMSEYDGNFVFVPIQKLQELRGMIDADSDVGFVTSIQIKLKAGSDLDLVRDKLRAAFPAELYSISTWRDKQGPLLAAVHMETAILNVLLFLIIAVAGFGILGIFFMIVVEKTRDIGILKSLGASGRGIQGIFLSYGLSLGGVGAGVGLVLGLLFVAYINEIAGVLGSITGHEVFDPNIYYFYKIPTIIEPATVAWVVAGAMAIAVMASILPARRAARLHPVEALRNE